MTSYLARLVQRSLPSRSEAVRPRPAEPFSGPDHIPELHAAATATPRRLASDVDTPDMPGDRRPTSAAPLAPDRRSAAPDPGRAPERVPSAAVPARAAELPAAKILGSVARAQEHAPSSPAPAPALPPPPVHVSEPAAPGRQHAADAAPQPRPITDESPRPVRDPVAAPAERHDAALGRDEPAPDRAAPPREPAMREPAEPAVTAIPTARGPAAGIMPTAAAPLPQPRSPAQPAAVTQRPAGLRAADHPGVRSRAAPPASAEPSVRVTIGRVEVRAVFEQRAAQPPARPPSPAMSLDEYLRQRDGGR